MLRSDLDYTLRFNCSYTLRIFFFLISIQWFIARFWWLSQFWLTNCVLLFGWRFSILIMIVLIISYFAVDFGPKVLTLIRHEWERDSRHVDAHSQIWIFVVATKWRVIKECKNKLHLVNWVCVVGGEGAVCTCLNLFFLKIIVYCTFFWCLCGECRWRIGGMNESDVSSPD